MSDFFGKKEALTSEQEALVDGFLELIKEEYDHEVSLSKAVVYGIMAKHSGDPDAGEAIKEVLEMDDTFEGDPEAPEIEETKEEAEADTKHYTKVSAEELDKKAVAFAVKMDANPEIKAGLHEYILIESKRKRITAEVALGFLTTFKDEEIDEQPWPSSRYDDKDIGNKPFDVRKAGEGSHYADVAYATEEGRTLVARKKSVTQAMDDKQTTPSEFKGWSNHDLEDEYQTCDDNLKALKASIKKAMSLCKRIRQVKTDTLLRANIRTRKADGKTFLVKGHLPLRVYYLKKDKESDANIVIDRWLSVSTFLSPNLNIAKIGTLPTAEDQLDAFVVKKGKKATKAEEGNILVIANASDYVTATFLMATQQTDKTFVANIWKEIASPSGGEFLDTMADVHSFFHGILNKPECKSKLAEYRQAKADAELKEQAIKNNKAKAA